MSNLPFFCLALLLSSTAPLVSAASTCVGGYFISAYPNLPIEISNLNGVDVQSLYVTFWSPAVPWQQLHQPVFIPCIGLIGDNLNATIKTKSDLPPASATTSEWLVSSNSAQNWLVGANPDYNFQFGVQPIGVFGSNVVDIAKPIASGSMRFVLWSFAQGEIFTTAVLTFSDSTQLSVSINRLEPIVLDVAVSECKFQAITFSTAGGYSVPTQPMFCNTTTAVDQSVYVILLAGAVQTNGWYITQFSLSPENELVKLG